ncbi:DUF721 domain-containing protein [Thermodesulfatator atlanticus]
MEPLGSVLKRMWAAPAWQKSLLAARILDSWEGIVGKPLARAVKPLGFARGVLILEVADNIWLQRLRFEEKRLLARLNELAGEAVFQRIRLILKRDRQNFYTKPPRKEVKLSEALLDRLRKELAIIEDNELREAFLRLRITITKKRMRYGAKRRATSSV